MASQVAASIVYTVLGNLDQPERAIAHVTRLRKDAAWRRLERRRQETAPAVVTDGRSDARRRGSQRTAQRDRSRRGVVAGDSVSRHRRRQPARRCDQVAACFAAMVRAAACAGSRPHRHDPRTIRQHREERRAGDPGILRSRFHGPAARQPDGRPADADVVHGDVGAVHARRRASAGDHRAAAATASMRTAPRRAPMPPPARLRSSSTSRGATSTFFLSPASGSHAFRVDVFWFGTNQGNPVTGFFPQFWDVLEPLGLPAALGQVSAVAGRVASRSTDGANIHRGSDGRRSANAWIRQGCS